MYVTQSIDDTDYEDIPYDPRLEKALNIISCNKNYNWINFNYSHFSDVYKKQTELINMQNIHGTSPFYKDYKPAIIGINSNVEDNKKFKVLNNNDQKSILKFTKKSQLKDQKMSLSKKLVDSNLKYIKFFGHSLSENDYQYFYSIFDKCNLYNEDIYLEFYYALHDKETNESAIKKQLDRVQRLLDSYSKTFSKKVDVFQKLSNENRIKIKNIDRCK